MSDQRMKRSMTVTEARLIFNKAMERVAERPKIVAETPCIICEDESTIGPNEPFWICGMEITTGVDLCESCHDNIRYEIEEMMKEGTK